MLIYVSFTFFSLIQDTGITFHFWVNAEGKIYSDYDGNQHQEYVGTVSEIRNWWSLQNFKGTQRMIKDKEVKLRIKMIVKEWLRIKRSN